MGEIVELEAEAVTVRGYLATPEGGHGPGILLMHAWWGLNDFFTELADRLAGEGFFVLAPDLYGGKTASTIEEAEELVEGLDYRKAIQYEVAAADYLLKRPSVEGGQIGAIGFSLGAAYATWLATMRPDLAAVVVFYGGVEQGEEFADQTEAAFLGHFAENDPYESPEMMRQLEERLRAAERDVTFHTYPGTGHWFFESDRPDAYNEEAARLAWERTLAFLHDKLG